MKKNRYTKVITITSLALLSLPLFYSFAIKRQSEADPEVPNKRARTLKSTLAAIAVGPLQKKAIDAYTASMAGKSLAAENQEAAYAAMLQALRPLSDDIIYEKILCGLVHTDAAIFVQHFLYIAQQQGTPLSLQYLKKFCVHAASELLYALITMPSPHEQIVNQTIEQLTSDDWMILEEIASSLTQRNNKSEFITASLQKIEAKLAGFYAVVHTPHTLVTIPLAAPFTIAMHAWETATPATRPDAQHALQEVFNQQNDDAKKQFLEYLVIDFGPRSHENAVNVQGLLKHLMTSDIEGVTSVQEIFLRQRVHVLHSILEKFETSYPETKQLLRGNFAPQFDARTMMLAQVMYIISSIGARLVTELIKANRIGEVKAFLSQLDPHIQKNMPYLIFTGLTRDFPTEWQRASAVQKLSFIQTVIKLFLPVSSSSAEDFRFFAQSVTKVMKESGLKDSLQELITTELSRLVDPEKTHEYQQIFQEEFHQYEHVETPEKVERVEV